MLLLVITYLECFYYPSRIAAAAGGGGGGCCGDSAAAAVANTPAADTTYGYTTDRTGRVDNIYTDDSTWRYC